MRQYISAVIAERNILPPLCIFHFSLDTFSDGTSLHTCFVKKMLLKNCIFSQTQYFEMDETERANVWKQKSFEEMKKKERMFEKMKLGQGEIGNEVRCYY